MATNDDQYVTLFINDMWRGKFNHLSDYLTQELDGGGMSDYIEDHGAYPEDDNVFYYAITGAFSLKRYDIVEYLLNKYPTKFTSELFISSYDFSGALEFLVSKGVNFNYNDMVSDCCVSGNITLLKYIVEKIKYNVTDLDLTGFEFMKKAIKEKSYKIIKYLINKLKFNINKVDDIGNSYLHYAVTRFYPEKLIMLLIDLGINKHVQNIHGHEARDMFKGKKYIKMLLDEYEPYLKTLKNEPLD